MNRLSFLAGLLSAFFDCQAFVSTKFIHPGRKTGL
jgi:hypothetical protein